MGKESSHRTDRGVGRLWLQRPWLSLLGLVALAASFAVAERGLTFWRSQTTQVPGARWIWAENVAFDPVAFLAAKDFEVSETLALNAKARLAIVADESYVVYLNGRYLGSNTYRTGAPIDTYELTGRLQGGRNRLVVELRSQRGVGGLLADLRVSDAKSIDKVRPILTSDGSWQIFRRQQAALFDLTKDLQSGEAPVVWQRAPTGRWRPSGELSQRPILETPKDPRGKRRRPKRVAPVSLRSLQGKRWVDLTTPRRQRPKVGPKVLFDWGKTVEGFLYFDLPSSDQAPALVYFGEEPPDPNTAPPDQVMVSIPGVDQWRDVHPRRFRYVLLIGVEPESRIEVRLVESDLATQLAPPPPARGGVFGLRPALRHSSVEELVWRRLRQEAAQSAAQGE